MKKNNNKGFTLIELLAVVVIMGILSVVAVSAVNRIMENTRKDTFIDTVKQYTNGAKTMWAADNLKCNVGGTDFLSSAVADGYYYVEVNSLSPNVPQLLDDGGKSSWGKREIAGYILIHVAQTGSGETATRKVTFKPMLVDGVHGVNVGKTAANGIEGANLGRGDLTMTGATYDKTMASGTLATDTAAKVVTTTPAAIKCVEA